MKERPILFNEAMVRALLDGRKTQTRRVIKPQPLGYTGRKFIVPDDSPKAWHDSDDFLSFCPYGQPGDRLWVRETWKPSIAHSCAMDACDCADVRVSYVADSGIKFFAEDDVSEEWLMPKAALAGRNVPAIHMPRWACRLLLEVTAVRVERLQEISAADARAEGCLPPDLPPDVSGVAGDYVADERTSFAILWNRINGPDSWQASPWVWVVEFRRIAAQLEADAA